MLSTGDPDIPGPMAPGRALPTGTDQTMRQGPCGLCIENLSRVRTEIISVITKKRSDTRVHWTLVRVKSIHCSSTLRRRKQTLHASGGLTTMLRSREGSQKRADSLVLHPRSSWARRHDLMTTCRLRSMFHGALRVCGSEDTWSWHARATITRVMGHGAWGMGHGAWGMSIGGLP